MNARSALRLICLTLTLTACAISRSASAQTNYFWRTPVSSLIIGGGPQGVAVDSVGNLFVADANKHVILEVMPLGTNWTVSTIAGSEGVYGTSDGTNSDAGFLSPGGVAVDNAGNLFVADSGNNAIRKITPSGTNWVVTTIAGNSHASGYLDGTNGDAQFAFPQGIAVDAAGNLFVGDENNNIIRKVAPSGTNWIVITIAGDPNNGGYLDGTNGAAQFLYPFGVAVDAADNVYVADAVNAAIRKLTPSGTNWIVTTIGGQGQSPGSADGLMNVSQFYFPVGVAVDAGGNVYVADQFNSTIREIIPMNGDWNTVTIGGLAGNPGNADGINETAAFSSPSSVAVDAYGDVYVTDNGNNNIRLGQILPWLQIQQAGSQMSVFYHFPAGTNPNFTLQSTTNLNDGNWDDVTNSWEMDTNGVASMPFTLTNTIPNMYFRLMR
jgi:hypothetical protein